jgi:hypothetical protein
MRLPQLDIWLQCPVNYYPIGFVYIVLLLDLLGRYLYISPSHDWEEVVGPCLPSIVAH